MLINFFDVCRYPVLRFFLKVFLSVIHTCFARNFWSLIVSCSKSYHAQWFSGCLPAESQLDVYILILASDWWPDILVDWTRNPTFPPVDNIQTATIVQRIRGRIIGTVLCCVVYHSCAETYECFDCWFSFSLNFCLLFVWSLSLFA